MTIKGTKRAVNHRFFSLLGFLRIDTSYSTSLNSGIFSTASTNDLTGNRVSNSFNGMFINAGNIGRGDSYGKVCAQDALLGRIEGNTFHGNGASNAPVCFSFLLYYS